MIEINLKEDLSLARLHFVTNRKGVIFLCDDYKIGADIKCPVDARVLVYCPGETEPDRESLT